MSTNRLWAIFISFWYFVLYAWLIYNAVASEVLFDRIAATVITLVSLPFFYINIRALWDVDGD